MPILHFSMNVDFHSIKEAFMPINIFYIKCLVSKKNVSLPNYLLSIHKLNKCLKVKYIKTKSGYFSLWD